MSALAQLLAQGNAYDAYDRQVGENQTRTLRDVQSAAGQMGILAQIAAQAKAQREAQIQSAYREKMANATTDEERASIAMQAEGPKGVLDHLDRVSRDKATAAHGLARLTQQSSQFDQNMQLRWSNAKDAREKANIEAQWRQGRLALETAHAQIAGKNLQYNTGTTVDIPATPTISTPSVAPIQGQAPDEASAVAAINAGGGRPMSIEIPNAVPQAQTPNAGLPTVAAQAAPAVAAPSVQPADAANLDARDLRARSAAPVAAPVAAPIVPQSSGPTVAPKKLSLADAPKDLSPKAKEKWLLDQEKASVAGHGGLTDEALTLAADQYLAGDATAAQGYARDQKARQALQNKIAERAREQGIGGKELAAIVGEFQGFKAGQRAVGTRQAQIEMAGTVTKEFVPLALEASDKFDRTEFKTLNDVEKAVLSRTASPELRQFNFANNALINAYARAINPNGVKTDADTKHAREILDTGFTKGDYKAAVEQLEKEIQAELRAPGSVKRDMRSLFTGDAAKPDRRAEPRPETKRTVVTY